MWCSLSYRSAVSTALLLTRNTAKKTSNYDMGSSTDQQVRREVCCVELVLAPYLVL